MSDSELNQDLERAAGIVAKSFAADEAVDSIFTSGSTTAGLGTSTSDADLFVVLKDDADHETDARQVVENGLRVDVEFVRLATLCDLVDRATAWSRSHSDATKPWPSWSNIDLVVRLANATELVGSDRLAALRGRLKDGSDRLRQLIIAKRGFEANGHFEDLRGCHADGDLATAALVGRNLMVSAGKALAAAAGDLYVGEKWVYRQLQRSLGDGFPLRRFRHLVEGRWVDRPDGYREIVDMAQTALVAAETYGWSAPSARRWTAWSFEPTGPLRNAEMIPIRLGDDIILNDERRRQFIVKPYIALLWGLSTLGTTQGFWNCVISSSLVSEEYSHLSESVCHAVRRELEELQLVAA